MYRYNQKSFSPIKRTGDEGFQLAGFDLHAPRADGGPPILINGQGRAGRGTQNHRGSGVGHRDVKREVWKTHVNEY